MSNTLTVLAVQYGNTVIPYVVRRSDRKTVGIAVEPSGTVVVTAPKTVALARLDRVVSSKAKWILGKINNRAALMSAPEREFVSGETFRFLGRQYRLRVVRSEQVQPVAIDGNHIVVHVPAGLSDDKAAAYVRSALVAWYKSSAKDLMASWLEPWAVAAGVAAPKVLVADQAKRWGSCTKSAIRINWRLIQAPRAAIDYVLAHEVTHLTHSHHDAAFWSALGRIMPDYEARKAQLYTLGPELTW